MIEDSNKLMSIEMWELKEELDFGFVRKGRRMVFLVIINFKVEFDLR